MLDTSTKRTNVSPVIAGATHVAIVSTLVIFQLASSDVQPYLGDAMIDRAGYFAAFAGPGIVILAARRSTPTVTAAAAVGVPTSLVLGSVFGLPSVILFIALIVSVTRNPTESMSWVSFAPAILLAVGLFALFITEDPISWTTTSGGGGSSDVIATHETLIAVAAVSGAIFIASRSSVTSSLT